MEKIYMRIERSPPMFETHGFRDETVGHYYYTFHLNRKGAIGGNASVVEVAISEGAKDKLTAQKKLTENKYFGTATVHISKRPSTLLFDEFFPYSEYSDQDDIYASSAGLEVGGHGIATALQRAISAHLKQAHAGYRIKLSRKITRDARIFFTKIGILPRNFRRPHTVEEFHALVERYHNDRQARGADKRRLAGRAQ